MAPNKDKIRASAQKHLQKGQIDKAIKEFQRLVELDPKDVRTLLKVGDLQTRAGKHHEATETYGKVAQFYSDQGFFLKAVAVYKQILKIDPTLVETNLKLAELYHQLGLLSDASNQYRQISQMYEKQGRIDESIDVLRRMVELDPENIASRIKLAEIYATQGMVDEARNEFRAAATYLTTHHRIDDYIKVAERIIHYDPSDLVTTRELANIYVQKGDARRALAKLQICFKADSKDPETLRLLANAFRDLGQIQKTISVYRELAHVHRESGENDAYYGVMQKILDLAPDDPEARAAAKQARSTLPTVPVERLEPVPRAPMIRQAPPEAAELEAVELDPVEIEVEDEEEEEEEEEEEIVLDQVEPGPAIEPERKAPAVPPGEAILRILTEVDVYVKYGLKNKALEHIQKVFELDANNVEAHRRRKDLLIEAGEATAAVSELWWLASAAHGAGDAGQARVDLEELLDIDPAHQNATQLYAQLGGPPAVSPGEIEVEVETEIDLGEEDLVVEASPPQTLDYEPSAAAAEIDLDEGYAEPSAEIAAALEDEPFDFDDEVPQSAVVSGESAVPMARTRPSEVMGAQMPDVATAETLSQSGSSAVDLAPAETAAQGEPQSVTIGVDEELDRLLASVPRAEIDTEPDPIIEPDVLVEPEPEPEPEPAATAPPAVDQPLVQEPRPHRAGVDLSEEIEEIEFFLQQGLESEAHDALETLLIAYPDNPELVALKAKLETRAAGAQQAADAGADDDIPEPETVQVETVDLAAELAQELDAAAGDDDFQVSFTDVFDDFKRGVAEQVDDADYQTHYDLGIAYKEMGLLDDAVREFGLAVKAPHGRIDALTMIGLCHLELGRTSEALEHFLKGLNSENVTAEEALALRFEIGQAYETMGRFGEAAKFYEKVHAMDASFRDVADRLADAESAAKGSAVSDELDALLTETAAEKSARGKISYV